MKCDADIHKNLCADIVLSGGGSISFQCVQRHVVRSPFHDPRTGLGAGGKVRVEEKILEMLYDGRSSSRTVQALTLS